MDDKLKEILSTFAAYMPGDASINTFRKEEDKYAPKFIAQIKQAFADEGYENTTFKTTELFKGHSPEYMTGQEWYDRFEKELRNHHSVKTLLDENYLKLAKKAAGL